MGHNHSLPGTWSGLAWLRSRSDIDPCPRAAVCFLVKQACQQAGMVTHVADTGGLVDRSSVLTLHNTWLDLLHRYCAGRYPDNPRRCGHILLRLLSLRSVSARAADKFLSCAVDVDVKMTDIVQEMIS